MMNKPFVFITGASSDIGYELCLLYQRHGFGIIAHYYSDNHKLKLLEKKYPDIFLIQYNLSDMDASEIIIQKYDHLFQQCNVFINAAAIMHPQPFEQITAKNILNVITCNAIHGFVFMSKLVPYMKNNDWGRIVHLSSIGVKFGGGSANFSYSLSKHMLEFIPADYRIWAKSNVFINTIRVGVTDTKIHHNIPGKDLNTRIDLIPAGRMASVQEMAKMIFWYGSLENSFITGECISVSGGE